MQVILASTSSARRALMNGLGIPYEAIAPGVDEAVTDLEVAQRVAELAERKAAAVATNHPHAIVIGADQLVCLDGQALGKPPNADAAFAQLGAMRGREHQIMTGVCVLAPGFARTEVDVARLTVRALSDDELWAYIATGEWQGCAGSYRVEGRGQAIFDRIEGDRTSVQGLPMQVVVRLLRQAGVRFF